MPKPEIAKYEFVPTEDNFWAIKLIDSDLAGITFRYGEVKFLGEDEDGNGKMSFDYHVLDAGPFEKEELVGDKINKILGDILTELIIESLKEREAAERGDNRENNSKESDLQ